MKQKQHKSTDLSSSNVPDNHQRNANYPNSGWGTSIENKLMFTQTELNRDIIRPRKNIGNKDHHSVPTTLHKAKTFIEDENLHEIQGTGDQQCFYFKPSVVTASEKNDPLNQLKLALCIVTEMYCTQAVPVWPEKWHFAIMFLL